MRIYIPTYGRSHRLRSVEFLPKVAELITLVVRPNEVHAYGSLGYDMAVLPRSVKDIAATRRAVGDIAAKAGVERFLMADDDLRILERNKELKLSPLRDGRRLLKALNKGLDMVSAVAISPRFMNQAEPRDIVHTKPQSQATAYRTEDYLRLKFGKAKYFEDVDRTLQLLTAGRNTAMLYSFAIDIGPMNTDGGMADWRNYADMVDEAAMMEKRWPGLVKACEVRDPKFWPDQPERGRPHIRMQWKKAYQPS